MIVFVIIAIVLMSLQLDLKNDTRVTISGAGACVTSYRAAIEALELISGVLLICRFPSFASKLWRGVFGPKGNIPKYKVALYTRISPIN